MSTDEINQVIEIINAHSEEFEKILETEEMKKGLKEMVSGIIIDIMEEFDEYM